MFAAFDLSEELDALHAAVAPRSQVVAVEREFETMPTDWVFELALITDDFDALAYPTNWVPDDALQAARKTTKRDPVIGMPDDGTITWTRQTEPPFVFVKPRASTIPAAFRDFLIGEALLEVAGEYPETPVCFFREDYATVQEIAGSPMVGYQLAAALRNAWIGRFTREQFRAWAEPYPELHGAWVDAGNRLRERVSNLPTLLADGKIGFSDATELACSALKHDLEVPAPFAALDVDAYSEQGATFAIRWLEETMED